jgi:hypothetical protein
MARTAILFIGPLLTGALTVMFWWQTEPMLFQLLPSSSLRLAWYISPLPPSHLLNRHTVILFHPSSDPSLTASNAEMLTGLAGLAIIISCQIILVSFGKFLGISLPTMEELKDWQRFVSGKR